MKSQTHRRVPSSLFLGAVFAVILSSCSGILPDLLPTSGLPTLIPTEFLPTAIALTSEAKLGQANRPTPKINFSPTAELSGETPIVQLSPTPTPTQQKPQQSQTPSQPTPTPPPPFEIPYADIQIVSPGALSKVASPINLHAFLIPGANGRVRVELFGEDGRLIFRKIFSFDSPEGAQANLWADIEFEIASVAEIARLVISTEDVYGRPQALTSQDLILLSYGDSDLNPHGDFLSPIVIQEPTEKILIQGGELVVSGLVRTASESPLLVEIVTTDGKFIGYRLAGVAPTPKNGHRLFAAKVPYAVNSPTWVRIIVSERGTRLPGKTQLSSIEVLLGP